MPMKLQKSLHEYFSKIKHPLIPSMKRKLSNCKHPKTPSFSFDRSHDQHHPQEEADPAATLADIDRFLLENFKSLYIENDGDEHKEHGGFDDDDEEEEEGNLDFQVKSSEGVLLNSRRFFESSVHHLCSSGRFFVAASLSGSLMEDAKRSLTGLNSSSDGELSRSTSKKINVKTLNSDEYVAVKTFSRSPSVDFKRSMQEMVEARLEEDDGKVDWELMEEILMCYLDLNEKDSHKFILSAFVDLVVGLRNCSDEVPAKPRRRSSPISVRRNSGMLLKV